MVEQAVIPLVNIDEPQWDQNTYWGRAKYFFTTANPINILRTSKELDEAREIVLKYKAGEQLVGKTLEDVYKAKYIMDSAFHPDTGEKMVLFGRMSAQVPCNMVIVGAMMTFYKSTPAVIFWQWVNQSFNALVNYTNRSGADPMPIEQVVKSYCAATGGALGTALTLNKLAKRAPPLVSRLVPFAAVAAANCINIPLMRYRELSEGIHIVSEDGTPLGQSQSAARKAIASVTFSRIAMVSPGMVLTPVIMQAFEKRGVLRRFPWANTPLQIILCGFFLTFATPMCCALFPQKVPVSIESLEPHVQESAQKISPDTKIGYYNKGL
ncbi:unnamed protein product [Bemisia tabaci]|uniref:Sidoreflexin n=1 Tax=Bemisia tabaci TaxID=7038 RepID=A0A9P0C9H2_BEMTA|nr:PREDICTED: sideroflexin-1 [Bemisia tabaci]CAH0753839.1 unnamed protein product [Bemisia tabaci]